MKPELQLVLTIVYSFSGGVIFDVPRVRMSEPDHNIKLAVE